MAIGTACALRRGSHDGSIHDLSAHGQEPVVLEHRIKPLKQFLNHTRLRPVFLVKPDRLRIRPLVRQAQAQKAHERQAVADQVLRQVITKVG